MQFSDVVCNFPFAQPPMAIDMMPCPNSRDFFSTPAASFITAVSNGAGAFQAVRNVVPTHRLQTTYLVNPATKQLAQDTMANRAAMAAAGASPQANFAC